MGDTGIKAKYVITINNCLQSLKSFWSIEFGLACFALIPVISDVASLSLSNKWRQVSPSSSNALTLASFIEKENFICQFIFSFLFHSYFFQLKVQWLTRVIELQREVKAFDVYCLLFLCQHDSVVNIWQPLYVHLERLNEKLKSRHLFSYQLVEENKWLIFRLPFFLNREICLNCFLKNHNFKNK